PRTDLAAHEHAPDQGADVHPARAERPAPAGHRGGTDRAHAAGEPGARLEHDRGARGPRPRDEGERRLRVLREGALPGTVPARAVVRASSSGRAAASSILPLSYTARRANRLARIASACDVRA